MTKPQIHASILETKCFEQIRRRHVCGDIIPPLVVAVSGTGTHDSIQKNLDNKIQTGNLLVLEEVRDHARDGVVRAWDGGVRLLPEEVKLGIAKVKADAIDRAVRLGSLHHEVVAPELQPTMVERAWTLALDGYPVDVSGRIDIQEGKRAIRDTKTSGKTPAKDVAYRSFQLKAYSLAVQILDGEAPQEVVLDYLIDTANPTAKPFSAKLCDADYRALLARIEVICVALEKGLFPPVEPSHWCCDPRWCGYSETCRYFVKRPVQI